MSDSGEGKTERQRHTDERKSDRERKRGKYRHRQEERSVYIERYIKVKTEESQTDGERWSSLVETLMFVTREEREERERREERMRDVRCSLYYCGVRGRASHL